jgi:hypothetical protein
VFENVLRRMQEKVRTLEYVVTLHAEEEMNDDELSIFDVESGIMTGKIIERQRDRETGEWKYLISGRTLEDDPIVVMAKLVQLTSWSFWPHISRRN